jgi:hypothetical protein
LPGAGTSSAHTFGVEAQRYESKVNQRAPERAVPGRIVVDASGSTIFPASGLELVYGNSGAGKTTL